MTDKATCQHLKVRRTIIEFAEGRRPEDWFCEDCGAEFFHLESFMTPRGMIQTMVPHATLRDEFAMAVLTGWLAAGEVGIWNHTDDALMQVAQEPYRMADAMLKAREAK